MNCKKYDIYIGCKSLSKYDEKQTFADIVNNLLDYFEKYKVGFSLTNQLGGYLYNDGTYITEQSIKITIIGNIDDNELNEFISVSKKMYKQENLLIVKKDINQKYR